jgi:hypothetical protein
MISPKELSALLRYDPESGYLFWKPRGREMFISEASWARWNSRYSGMVAGSDGEDGNGRPYRKITVFRKTYSAHRVAWAIMNGDWPKDQIDHIDRNPMNNAWRNLRPASSYENMNNRGLQKNNLSGVSGVSWCKIRNLWRVRPMCGGRRVDGGYFQDIDIAAMEAMEIRCELGYPPTAQSSRRNP